MATKAELEAEMNQAIALVSAQSIPDRAKQELIAKVRAQYAQAMHSAELEDPAATNGFQYGGQPGAADADVTRYRDMAAGIAGRAPIQADFTQANQARADQDEIRNMQLDAAGMYRRAALGQGPSVAGAMYQQNLDRGIQGMMSTANSARGGALALSQGRLAAMQQGAGMMAGSAAQAAELRAREIEAARGGYAGLGSQIRGQDIGVRGQDIDAAKAQAGFAMGSRQLNDATGLAYEGLGQGVRGMQMNGNLAHEAAKQGNIDRLYQQARDIEARNAETSARNAAIFQGVASVAMPVAGAAIGKAASAAAPVPKYNPNDPGY